MAGVLWRGQSGSVTTIREEPRHLMDQLSSAPELVRERLAGSAPAERHLPFFASFDAEPDFAQRNQDILRSGWVDDVPLP